MNKIADFRLRNERDILHISEAAGWLVRPILKMLQQYHQAECPEPLRAH
ncbi:hypothetical protein [Microvirga calopogonii]|nr:hypothetical protein [Microvirga calopogonii]